MEKIIIKFLEKIGIKNKFKEKNKKLQNIYKKIDKIDKDKDFIMINSSEGLTEDEYLKVLQNELFGEKQ